MYVVRQVNESPSPRWLVQ